MSSIRQARYLILALLTLAVLFSVWGCSKSAKDAFPGVSKYFPAKVNEKDKWGLVDARGTYLVEKKWKNQPSGVYQNMLYVSDDEGMYEYFKVSKNPKKIGAKYFDAAPFSEGMAAVVAGKEDKKHIEYIDLSGKTKFRLEKLDGKQILSASRFNEGMAWVKNEDGKFGFIDKSGKLVIKCNYDLADLFHEGLARVAKESKGNPKFGFINKAGKEVIALKEKRTYGSFSDGYCWFTETRDGGEYKKGTINKKGKIIIEPTDEIKEASNFKAGLASYNDGESWGMLNPKGKPVIRPRYNGIIQVPLGMIVMAGGKFGVIDSKDKEVFPLTNDYQLIIPMGTNRFLVNKKDKWLFVDNKGKQKGKNSFAMFGIDGVIGYDIAPESVRFELYQPLPDFGDYGDAEPGSVEEAPEPVRM